MLLWKAGWRELLCGERAEEDSERRGENHEVLFGFLFFLQVGGGGSQPRKREGEDGAESVAARLCRGDAGEKNKNVGEVGAAVLSGQPAGEEDNEGWGRAASFFYEGEEEV